MELFSTSFTTSIIDASAIFLVAVGVFLSLIVF